MLFWVNQTDFILDSSVGRALEQQTEYRGFDSNRSQTI